jgi:hypothetical protein
MTPTGVRRKLSAISSADVAARLESLAASGGVCVSLSAFEQIENKMTFGGEVLGDLRVKNIARPIRVYRIWENGGNAACKGRCSVAAVQRRTACSDRTGSE